MCARCSSFDEPGYGQGAAHITGGGFLENIPRMLPEGTAAQIDYGTWPVPEVFRLSREIGNLT